MSDPECAICTRELTRCFGDLLAVDHLSLTVKSGSIFGFLGPNGSGKTTTLRLLLGLLEPTSGSGTVMGYDVATQASEIRACTGALLEHNGLYERLSVYDNLAFYARIWRLAKQQRSERIAALLTHLALWDRRDDPVQTLSKGMRQKLAVARAMLHRPKLLILDEPTSGLDPVVAASLRDDIAALAKDEGTTVFLNTHNLSEAEKLCDTVGVIRYGKLLVVDAPERLRARQGGNKVRIVGQGFGSRLAALLLARPEVHRVDAQDGRLELTVEPDTEVGALVSLIVGTGAQVEEVSRGVSHLEDVFLALMAEAPDEGRG